MPAPFDQRYRDVLLTAEPNDLREAMLAAMDCLTEFTIGTSIAHAQEHDAPPPAINYGPLPCAICFGLQKTKALLAAHFEAWEEVIALQRYFASEAVPS